jgi:hypothetical protein
VPPQGRPTDITVQLTTTAASAVTSSGRIASRRCRSEPFVSGRRPPDRPADDRWRRGRRFVRIRLRTGRFRDAERRGSQERPHRRGEREPHGSGTAARARCRGVRRRASRRRGDAQRCAGSRRRGVAAVGAVLGSRQHGRRRPLRGRGRASGNGLCERRSRRRLPERKRARARSSRKARPSICPSRCTERGRSTEPWSRPTARVRVRPRSSHSRLGATARRPPPTSRAISSSTSFRKDPFLSSPTLSRASIARVSR